MAAGEKYTEWEIKGIMNAFETGMTDDDLNDLAHDLKRTPTGILAKAQTLENLNDTNGYLKSAAIDSPAKDYKPIDYKEALKHPKWQRKRLEVMGRDDFTCVKCSDKETTLHVHHVQYNHGCNPWEYDNENLVTLCKDCHKEIELLKKEDRFKDIEFDKISIYKSNGWSNGTKIMFASTNNVCSMRIEEDGKHVIGFNFNESLVCEIIAIMNKIYV